MPRVIQLENDRRLLVDEHGAYEIWDDRRVQQLALIKFPLLSEADWAAIREDRDAQGLARDWDTV